MKQWSRTVLAAVCHMWSLRGLQLTLSVRPHGWVLARGPGEALSEHDLGPFSFQSKALWCYQTMPQGHGGLFTEMG